MCGIEINCSNKIKLKKNAKTYLEPDPSARSSNSLKAIHIVTQQAQAAKMKVMVLALLVIFVLHHNQAQAGRLPNFPPTRDTVRDILQVGGEVDGPDRTVPSEKESKRSLEYLENLLLSILGSVAHALGPRQ